MPEPRARHGLGAYWPFALAAFVTLTLLGLYLVGCFTAVWALTIALIVFPLLYVIGAVAWLEIMKWIERRKQD